MTISTVTAKRKEDPQHYGKKSKNRPQGEPIATENMKISISKKMLKFDAEEHEDKSENLSTLILTTVDFRPGRWGASWRLLATI